MTALTEYEILENIENYLCTLLPRLKALDPLTLHYFLSKAIANSMAALYQRNEAILDTVDPLRATGVDLDHIVSSRLLTRIPGNYATGSITFARNSPSATPVTIPAGTRCTAGDTYFVTTAAGTIAAGTLEISVAATAEERGLDGNVSDYTINNIYTACPGVDSCYNPLAFANGTAEETDAELRQRYIDVTTLPGLATLEMIERRLEDLEYVSEAKAFNRSEGDIEIVVDDSLGIATVDDDVVSELEAVIAAGCQARGCLAAQALASGGEVVVGETVNEDPDGTLDVFTVDSAFVANSERLYLNGIVQIRDIDYTTTPLTGTFNILWSPLPDAGIGDILTADYITSAVVPVIDPISLTSNDCSGGMVWVRPHDFVSATDTFQFDYLTTAGTTHTGTAVVPAGTHRGEFVEVVLESTLDRAVSIPAQSFSGANDYDICLGLGEPNYLYNVPTEVTISVVLDLVGTDTPESNLAANIKASIEAWLSDATIGENVEFSDLRSAATIEYVPATDPTLKHVLRGTERIFIGVDRITSFRVSGGGQSAQVDGDIITLEQDEICRKGNVSVNVT